MFFICSLNDVSRTGSRVPSFVPPSSPRPAFHLAGCWSSSFRCRFRRMQCWCRDDRAVWACLLPDHSPGRSTLRPISPGWRWPVSARCPGTIHGLLGGQLAAAIRVGADVIVPRNLRDFPADRLAPHAPAAEHPDAFLAGLADRSRSGLVEIGPGSGAGHPVGNHADHDGGNGKTEHEERPGGKVSGGRCQNSGNDRNAAAQQGTPQIVRAVRPAPGHCRQNQAREDDVHAQQLNGCGDRKCKQ